MSIFKNLNVSKQQELLRLAQKLKSEDYDEDARSDENQNTLNNDQL